MNHFIFKLYETKWDMVAKYIKIRKVRNYPWVRRNSIRRNHINKDN